MVVWEVPTKDIERDLSLTVTPAESRQELSLESLSLLFWDMDTGLRG